MEEKQTVTIRILKQTHTFLKVIAALSQESMLQTIHRLAEQEYKRLQEAKNAENLQISVVSHEEAGRDVAMDT